MNVITKYFNWLQKDVPVGEVEKYLPKYDGYCATVVAIDKLVESDPQLFSVNDSATSFFSNLMAEESFDEDSQMTIKNANKNFASL